MQIACENKKSTCLKILLFSQASGEDGKYQVMWRYSSPLCLTKYKKPFTTNEERLQHGLAMRTCSNNK